MSMMYIVTLFLESDTLHEKWELVSMDNVELCMKSEFRYPWTIFIYTKQIIFCE